MGEIIGQLLRASVSKPKNDKACSDLSIRRILASALYGGMITGPVLHWWYNQLEKLVVKQKKVPGGQVWKKLIYDRLVFTPPFLAGTLIAVRLFCGPLYPMLKS